VVVDLLNLLAPCWLLSWHQTSLTPSHKHINTQLAARDEAIKEGQSAMLAEQRRCKELETHKFVLGYKVEQLQKALEPQEGAAAAARAVIAAQERELLGSHSALLAARRAAAEKDAALRVLQQEAWELKQRSARQGQLLDAFASELFAVSRVGCCCRLSALAACMCTHNPSLRYPSAPSSTQAVSKSDERPPNGKSERAKALDALVAKYCTR